MNDPVEDQASLFLVQDGHKEFSTKRSSMVTGSGCGLNLTWIIAKKCKKDDQSVV